MDYIGLAVEFNSDMRNASHDAKTTHCNLVKHHSLPSKINLLEFVSGN